MNTQRKKRIINPCIIWAVVTTIGVTAATTLFLTGNLSRDSSHTHHAPKPEADTLIPDIEPDTFYNFKYDATFPNYLKDWVTFADKNACLVTTGYEVLMEKMNALRARGPLTIHSLEEAKRLVVAPHLINHCKVRRGTIECSLPDSLCVDQPVGKKGLYQPFVHLLPDMDILCDISDKSYKLLGEKNPLKINTPNGLILPQDVDGNQQLACVRARLMEHVPPMPIFTRSWVPGCSGSLVIPGTLDAMSDDIQEPDFWKQIPRHWTEKADRVSWVGSPTGTLIKDGVDWRSSHRLQLVSRFGKPGSFGEGITSNVAFKGVPGDCLLGGSNQACHDLVCGEYTCVGERSHAEQFQAKFIVDIDGNGWSSRFVTMLASGSVILKATRYASWWHGRALPWVHYVPFDIRLDTLNSTVQWLHKHPLIANRIATAAKKLVMTHMRDVDVQCFSFRALLEYNELFEKQ